jgi:hypothetical protein
VGEGQFVVRLTRLNQNSRLQYEDRGSVDGHGVAEVSSWHLATDDVRHKMSAYGGDSGSYRRTLETTLPKRNSACRLFDHFIGAHE